MWAYMHDSSRMTTETQLNTREDQANDTSRVTEMNI